MNEQQTGQVGSGWLGRAKTSDFLPYVMFFKPNQKRIVRLFNKEEPISVWRHTCRTSEGRFIKAYCRGDFDNIKDKCPLCLVNTSEKYRDLKGKDKPFPKSSEYVKAVWSYDDDKPMLLVGNDIWRRIDAVLAQGVDIFKYDIAVSRIDEESKPTYYNAAALPDRMAFDKVIDPVTVPAVETYIQWLKDNLGKVPVTVPSTTIVREEVKTVEVAASEVGKILTAPSDKRGKLKAKFADLLNAGWNSALIAQLMEEINAKRKLMNAASPLANDLDGLNDDEYESFVNSYEAGNKKK